MRNAQTRVAALNSRNWGNVASRAGRIHCYAVANLVLHVERTAVADGAKGNGAPCQSWCSGGKRVGARGWSKRPIADSSNSLPACDRASAVDGPAAARRCEAYANAANRIAILVGDLYRRFDPHRRACKPPLTVPAVQNTHRGGGSGKRIGSIDAINLLLSCREHRPNFNFLRLGGRSSKGPIVSCVALCVGNG